MKCAAPTPSSSPCTLLPPANACGHSSSAVSSRPYSTIWKIAAISLLPLLMTWTSSVLSWFPPGHPRDPELQMPMLEGMPSSPEWKWSIALPHRKYLLFHNREGGPQIVTNWRKKHKSKLEVGKPPFLKLLLATLLLAFPKVPAREKPIPRSSDNQSCNGYTG